MFSIRAMVAQAPHEREKGLMYRTEMAQHEGMLFVFEQPSRQCFWMRNTVLPLDAAFVANDGTVINIEAMQAQTEDAHCSAQPVRYVLEMNQGWFKRRNIGPGYRITGGPFKVQPTSAPNSSGAR